MEKYVCDVCGYVYDEAAGDPDNGIAPGTRWEDLPPVWRRQGHVLPGLTEPAFLTSEYRWKGRGCISTGIVRFS